jgi:glutamate N-acetyltransferase / amino-acid N-acetyltransferase
VNHPARDAGPARRVPVDRRLGVTAAAGFGAAGVACGLKPGNRPDLALVVGDPGTVAAGVFTTNLVVAAPVVWSRARLAASADARVVVLNAGNANACTGPAGDAAVLATAQRAAAELGCRPEQVLVCSTGVIGVPLDVARVTDGVAKAAVTLDRSGGQAAAEAILTTDTVAKQAGVRVPGGATVAGMAKGAAMLAPALAPPEAGGDLPVDRGTPSGPDRPGSGGVPRTPPAGPLRVDRGTPSGFPGPLRVDRGTPSGFPGPLRHATMLVVLTTDAVAEPAALRAALAAASATTFNRITVDGAQSTNDTVLLLASGASGVRPSGDDLAGAVEAVCGDLAGQMLADAEGGSKVVDVQVGGAGGVAEALAVARRVADSPLVKAAVYGGDPNWGRVLQAAGTAGVDFDPAAVRLEVAGGPGAAGIEAPAGPLERITLVRLGVPTGADARAAMACREIELRLHLGGRGPWAGVRTSDLTPEYVRLNSEYTT